MALSTQFQSAFLVPQAVPGVVWSNPNAKRSEHRSEFTQL
jgi:hypothetical protein